jgi:hypothetical protein
VKPNPLIEQAKTERHKNCDYLICKSCGANVSTYNANWPFIKHRPEADEWDWWAACDNANCEHAYGEGYFQTKLKWTTSK